MFSFLRVGIIVFVFSFLAILVACGDSSTEDEGNVNNSDNNQSENQASNEESETNVGDVEGIELPELVLKEGEFSIQARDIIASIAKMDIEWTIEEAPYKLNYEWIEEREVDGELVDYFTFEFEDVSAANKLVMEGEAAEGDSFAEIIESEETGPTVADYDGGIMYYAFTQWTFLFEFFNTYRTFLKNDDIPLAAYETETSTLGSSEVDIHYLTLAEGSGFVGLGFGGERIKLATIDDLELLLSIEGENTDRLVMDVKAFETR